MTVSISIAVPVYSGEKYLERLVAEVAKIQTGWLEQDAPMVLKELIFADDDAIDGSPSLIDRLSREVRWVRGVHLSRNFGQHAATVAAILETESDWVVTMDEDLQHLPSRIVDLLRVAVQTQSDLVYGRPQGAVHQSIARDLTSHVFKRLVVWLTGNPHISSVNSFRLIRGPLARGASACATHDVYLDVALHWFTSRIQTVSMELKDTRFITTKKSGYRYRSLLSHARRLLISSQIKMLRMGIAFGFVVTATSVVMALLLLAIRVFVPESINAVGWTSLMITIMFFGGVGVFLIGIVLEYLSVVLLRSSGRPLFIKVDRSSDENVAAFFRKHGVAARQGNGRRV
jgi:glycosyltransferase involved in cell wall biosynthesis